MNEPLPEKDLLALVDRLLLEQGRPDPFELLLAAGLLAYQDYEAWRMGRMPDIQGALSVAPRKAAELLERAAAYALGQKLAATPLEHSGWGDLDQPLRVGTDAGLIRGCAAAFAPPDDRHQLDLFHDSSALLLEEEIRRALAERRIDAEACWQRRDAAAAWRDWLWLCWEFPPRGRACPGFPHLSRSAARCYAWSRVRNK